MTFRKKAPMRPPEAMIVGLGNPGGEYRGTRHNVGFDVIEALAERARIKVSAGRHQALTGQGEIAGVPVLLARPLTFMNMSGRSVAPWARQLGLRPDQILVIADDVDLPVGRLRMRGKGSAGGHNGHKSIIQTLGTQDYPRLKVGVGAAEDGMIDHVLGRFTPEERTDIRDAIQRAVEGIEIWLSDGLEAAMNRINPQG